MLHAARRAVAWVCVPASEREPDVGARDWGGTDRRHEFIVAHQHLTAAPFCVSGVL